MSSKDNETPLPELSLKWIQNTKLLEIPEGAKQLLEDYAKIEHENLQAHIESVRERALKTYPYPCIGQFRFLDIQIVKSTAYEEIKGRLEKGQKLLDVGCCIGQELRQLVADGADSMNLYGTDLYGEFFDIGFELFQDRETFQGSLITADIFAPPSQLSRLNGELDVIWTSSVLHLFTWKQQVAALTRMLELLSKSSDPLIAGRFMGHLDAGEHHFRFGEDKQTLYRHNDKTFKSLFQAACDEIGEEWALKVEAPNWVETLKLESTDKPTSTWTLEVKFVGRKLAK